MMIRCPGCGGRNPRDALSCDWCHRPFVQSGKRGLSARWWGALSAAIIGVLLILVGALLVLNASRTTNRAAAAPTPSPPAAPPPQIASPPATPSLPTAVPTPTPAPVAAPPPPPTATATPAARYARIANTSGLGANLRREPAASAQPVAAAAENATVYLLGPEQRAADGRVWRQVEDNRGNQGWVPADFLVEAPAPGGR